MQRNKRLIIYTILILIIAFALCSCGNGDSQTASSNSTGFYGAFPGNYDSADTAILMKINQTESTMQFMTMVDGRKYTLNYDGATTLLDNHGQALTLMQITPGMIVDVTFMKDRKRLNSLAINSECFYFSGLSDFQLYPDNRKMVINGAEYTFSHDMIIMRPGGEGELLDVNNVDTISVMGFNHTISSIIIEKSHGYLRLDGDAFFIGGWIEVADSNIYQIEEDMVLPVPVGTYEVTVSNRGCVGTEVITVEENREYLLDISKYQGEAEKGNLIFTITPDNASVFIDNKEIDISKALELDYGIHQLVIRAEGYQTITKFIKVGSPNANVDITMEKNEDASTSSNSASSNSASSNTASSNSASSNSVSNNTPVEPPAGTGLVTTPAVSNNTATQTVSNNVISPADVITTSSGARVYINEPLDCEVFVNGIYVGITPVSFIKKAGNIEIVIRRNGYESRAYTLEIDDSSEDVNYSFSELLEQTHE